MQDLTNPLLESLTWHRIRLTLRCTRYSASVKEPLYKILDVAARAIWVRAGFPAEERKLGLAARAVAKPYDWRPTEGEVFLWDLMIFRSREKASALRSAALTHFSDPRNNYRIEGIPKIEARNLRIIAEGNAAARQLLEGSQEIALDFPMPLPFRKEEGHQRCHLSAEHFTALLADRVERVFGISLNRAALATGWRTLPYYWEWVQEKRVSARFLDAARAGTHAAPRLEWLEGGQGTLVIKGELRQIAPLIIIGSETNLGEDPDGPVRLEGPLKQSVGGSRGYYQLREEAFHPLSRELLDGCAKGMALDDILERRDDAFVLRRSKETRGTAPARRVS